LLFPFLAFMKCYHHVFWLTFECDVIYETKQNTVINTYRYGRDGVDRFCQHWGKVDYKSSSYNDVHWINTKCQLFLKLYRYHEHYVISLRMKHGWLDKPGRCEGDMEMNLHIIRLNRDWLQFLFSERDVAYSQVNQFLIGSFVSVCVTVISLTPPWINTLS
jgi:hypothetical protein